MMSPFGPLERLRQAVRPATSARCAVRRRGDQCEAPAPIEFLRSCTGCERTKADPVCRPHAARHMNRLGQCAACNTRSVKVELIVDLEA